MIIQLDKLKKEAALYLINTIIYASKMMATYNTNHLNIRA